MKSVRLPARLWPEPEPTGGPSPICPCENARWWPRRADLSGGRPELGARFPASIGVPPWLMDLECPLAFGNRYVCSGAPGKLGTIEGVSLPSADIFNHLRNSESSFSFHLKTADCHSLLCVSFYNKLSEEAGKWAEVEPNIWFEDFQEISLPFHTSHNYFYPGKAVH